MVDSADRDDELVAHTAPECTRLCKGEMMRIRRHAAAHEARLSQHESAGDPYRAGEPFFPKHGLHRCEIAFWWPAIGAFWRVAASDALDTPVCSETA